MPLSTNVGSTKRFSDCASHSGYHLPFQPSPEFHDFHHKIFNSNFGGSHGLLDYLHGTDANWQRSIQQEHDIFLPSLDTVKVYIERQKASTIKTPQAASLSSEQKKKSKRE